MNISRRWFITVSGTAAAAALAGCSSQDGSSSTEGSPQPESTPETTTSGQEETVTEEQTETGQGQQPYEENESGAESDFENSIGITYVHGWVEMENPEEQFPEENLDDETYPTLRAFTHPEHGLNPYDAEESFYLGFGEEGPHIVTAGAKIDEYGGEIETQTSGGFTEEDADIVGILEDVVEGYDDVSENMPEEYLEALQS